LNQAWNTHRFDRVSDYVWLRPYLGSAVSFVHQTWTIASPLGIPPVSDSGLGARFYGGGELTFAGMPQFGVSADLGYRHLPLRLPDSNRIR
jgi:hypothetical protein